MHTSSTSIKWKVWNADGDTLVHSEQSLTSNMRSHGVDRVETGLMSAPGGTQIYYLDSLVVDDAGYPGPIVAAGGNEYTASGDITPAGALYRQLTLNRSLSGEL